MIRILILTIIISSCSVSKSTYLHSNKNLQLKNLQKVIDVNVVVDIKKDWIIFKSAPNVVDSFQTKYAENIQVGDVFSEYYSRY